MVLLVDWGCRSAAGKSGKAQYRDSRNLSWSCSIPQGRWQPQTSFSYSCIKTRVSPSMPNASLGTLLAQTTPALGCLQLCSEMGFCSGSSLGPTALRFQNLDSRVEASLYGPENTKAFSFSVYFRDWSCNCSHPPEKKGKCNVLQERKTGKCIYLLIYLFICYSSRMLLGMGTHRISRSFPKFPWVESLPSPFLPSSSLPGPMNTASSKALMDASLFLKRNFYHTLPTIKTEIHQLCHFHVNTRITGCQSENLSVLLPQLGQNIHPLC